LAFIRGRWVEIDRERLNRALEQFKAIERRAADDGLSFGEAMRLLAGARIASDPATGVEVEAYWSQVAAGPWLTQTLAELRQPDGSLRVNPARSLQGTLRPYQQTGVQWLHLLARLGLGACLADDMGLGKTIQVLSLLLLQKERAVGERKPSLLVAPASLLANWAAEIDRFAPSLKVLVAHPSIMPVEELRHVDQTTELGGTDLVITSYGFLNRMPWLPATRWRLVVLDEAQAIKNPSSKQTRAVKQLCADARIALTGTPIENRLADLWSIFDFLNPGLLGSAKQFSSYIKQIGQVGTSNSYGPLRELVRP
jgi:non-specific serine/threonine protein kinase